MATAAPTAMPTDDAVLTLAHWFSPSYPIGSFSFSHGLEWAAQAGTVNNGADLTDWLKDVLDDGAGRSDALFLAAAYHAQSEDAVTLIDQTARAFAPSSERLAETHKQGNAFCKITQDVWGTELPDLSYPVAVGRAARLCGLPQKLAAAMYLQSFVANLVAAAQRLCPIGQTEAQTIVRQLTPLCNQIAADTIHGDLDQLSGTAFLADIASMKHETQYSRIFQT
ncbi:urease accessory protein UreF [Thalassococcus lentus]|uniref:Urease accessory protein UreF n=1 Tax=Thalassococcus lentus TaxID=1210524 RepID=A0ABT4XPG0_9RHOB|nr:urease accessory protein UreF [Thalassococcus lentus]MDA7423836.1 urease accessory protein UreF [Thalassococcus lentus]